jgi:Xaa-Pro dipeptidase
MSAIAQRGTMALEDGAGPDFAALRSARRDRVFDAMAQQGLDVLMLNRGGNARYVVGHRPIWRSVVTAWAPMCTVVAATRRVHLMAATWDDGIPADIPHDSLSQLMWNPRKIFASIGQIPGLADAGSIAVDGMSPSMPAALKMFAPNARLVDAERMMRQLRAVKLPGEIDAVRMAIAMTEGALAALRDEVRPGVRELDVKSRFHEELCRFGVNHPAMEGTFCATPRDDEQRSLGLPPVRLLPDRRTLDAGDLVAVAASVPYAGYEGVVARTWPCVGPAGRPSAAQHALHDRWRVAHDALVERCRAGLPVTELARAWTATGEPLPPTPLAYGVGLGVEYPVVGGAGALAAPEEPLLPGMVLGIQGYVWERGVGGYLGAETVLITDDAPQRLTRLSHDPLSAR